jgi:putative ABC transport system permease protein
VVRSERTNGLQAPLENVAYVCLAQFPQPDIRILVRTAIEPPAALSGIREAVRQVDPDMPLAEVRTMEQVKEQSMLWAKQPAWVIAAFAAVAALLAALGLYAVLAQAVAQQRREIGIRMALGAWQGEVASRVLRGAFSMIVIGLAVGLAGALALTRVLKSLLFGVSPLDPLALAAACLLMTVVGMVAAWVPTSRAVRVDPMMVLRDEV